MSLQKSSDESEKVVKIPSVNEVVSFLETPSKERTKEDITYVTRFFGQK